MNSQASPAAKPSRESADEEKFIEYVNYIGGLATMNQKISGLPSSPRNERRATLTAAGLSKQNLPKYSSCETILWSCFIDVNVSRRSAVFPFRAMRRMIPSLTVRVPGPGPRVSFRIVDSVLRLEFAWVV
jgi:hypothetical protein